MMFKARYKDIHADLWPTNYRIGMWAWLFQKVSGIYIIVYGVIHLWETSTALAGVNGQAFDWLYKEVGLTQFIQALDLVTFVFLLYHTTNGLRIILLDLGIGVRSHRLVFWVLMAAWVVLFGFVANALLPLVIGRR
ncbi:MAG: succinate dehydrogenase, cytochrome b556 subunit [Chloroflexi bacterium]|nr:succinate dehydrogenase, cytochrome b556 subunit [Chloroflexota bacterium]